MVHVLLNSAVGTLSWCVNISNTTLYTLNILPKKVLINFPWMSLKKKKGKQNYYLIQPWFFISHCGRTGILWISEKGRLFLQSRSKPCPLLEGLSTKRIFFNWSIAINLFIIDPIHSTVKLPCLKAFSSLGSRGHGVGVAAGRRLGRGPASLFWTRPDTSATPQVWTGSSHHFSSNHHGQNPCPSVVKNLWAEAEICSEMSRGPMKELWTQNSFLLSHSTFPFWFRVNFIPLACSLHGMLFDHRAEVGNRAFLPGHRLLTLTPSSNYFSDTVHFAVSSSEVAFFFSSYTSSFESPIPESTEKVIIEDSRGMPTHMKPSSTRHSSHDG